MGKRSEGDSKAGTAKGLRITRRGAIAVSAGALVPAAMQAQGRDIVRTTYQNGVAQVEFTDSAGRVFKWSLDPRDFAGSPQLEVDTERDVVRLIGARWPGTVLREGGFERRVDFTLRIYRSESRWRVSLRYDALGEQAAAEARLEAWMRDGAPLVAPLRRALSLVVGAPSRPLSIAIDPSGERRPSLAFFVTNAWRIEGDLRLDAGAGGFEASEAGFVDLKASRPPSGTPTTQVSAPTEALRSEAVTLDAGRVQDAGTARITHKPVAVVITGQEASGQRSCVCTVQGKGGFLDLPELTSTTPPFGVRLKASTTVETRTAAARTVSLEAQLSDAPVAIGLGPALLRVAGVPQETISATFNGQTPASVTLPLILAGVELPVRGASMARVVFPTPRRLGLDLGGDPANYKAFLKLRPGAGATRLTVELAESRLQVQRYRDLLNLGFELRGFRLEAGASSVGVKPGAANAAHYLVVHLGPQHIAERAYYRQLDSTVPDATQPPFEEVVEGRASGPSRLAFVAPPATRSRDWLDLAQLLDWDALSTSANWRAQPRIINWDEVWTGLGNPAPNTPRATLLQTVEASLKAPEAHETAVETPYRLILSPPRDSKWLTSTPADDPEDGSILWHARLDPENGGDSVRVLKARGARDVLARTLSPQPDDAPWPKAGVDISVPKDARRELMALSSAFAVPALKRTTRGTTGQVEVDRVFSFLKDEEGIYVPTPLKSAKMALTSLGGTLIAEGHWEPPSPLTIPDNWVRALSYERWTHRAMLGRDVFAEVVIKGFLFPLGHRASFVRLTERLFFPHPRTGEPTAYLIQRTFIEIANPKKPFPAVNQPFDGRMFPDVTDVTLKTTRTPDLIDPVGPGPLLPGGFYDTQTGAPLESNGGLKLATTKNPLAFWPRLTRKAGSEVRFEWTVNGKPTLMRGPLMFVDNTVAHNPTFMRAVLEHYMGCATWSNDAATLRKLRTAKYGGSPHRYAPSDDDGQTEFETTSWTFAATGRRSRTGALACLDPLLPRGVECEDFTVDSVMEGQDQPPFYPMLESAKMRVQSLDRLTDRPGQLLTAAPNFAFIEGGFDPARNPGELFLDILDPQPSLDFGGVGDRAGGVAQPNLKVVALSRTSGPVGGKSSLRPAPSRLTTSFAQGEPLGVAARAPTPSSAAQSGKFDPFEFFGDAKLLGAVPLKEVVRAAALAAAPKLVEAAEYGGGAAFATTASAVTKAATPLKAVLATVETQLKAAARTLGLGEDAWTELYPRLAKALTAARKALTAAEAAARGSDPAKMISSVTAAVREFTAFADRLAEAIANPVPTFVKDAIGKLTGAWAALTDLADLSRLLAAAFKADLYWPQSIRDALCLNGKPTAFAIAYLGLPEDECVSPGALAEIVERLQMGLVHETLGRPLAELEGALGDLVITKRNEIGERVAGLVVRGLDFASASGAMALAARISGGLSDTWTSMSRVHKALADGLMATDPDLLSNLAAIEGDLAELRPQMAAGPLQSQLVVHRAAALGATQRFRATLETAQVLRKKIANGEIAAMELAGLPTVTRFHRLRAEALGHLRDAVAEAVELADVLSAAGAAADAGLVDARQRLDRAVTKMNVLLQGVSSVGKLTGSGQPAAFKVSLEPVVKPWRDRGAAQAGAVDRAADEIVREAAALKANLDVARVDLSAAIGAARRAPRELGALSVDIVTYAIQQDRRLAGLIAGGSKLAGTLESALIDWAFQAMQRAAAVGDQIETKVYDGITPIIAMLDGGPASEALKLLLRPEIINAAKASYADLGGERDKLRAIATAAAQDTTRAAALTSLDQLRMTWRQKPTALVDALNAMEALAEALLHGQLGKLPDLKTAWDPLESTCRHASLSIL